MNWDWETFESIVYGKAITRYQKIMKNIAKTKFTLTSSLHATDNKKVSNFYASKFLHNIIKLKRKYKMCVIVVYYDHTVSKKFVRRAKEEGAILKFVRHDGIKGGMLLTRFLEFDNPKNEWTFTIDLHEEQPMPQHSTLIQKCLSNPRLNIGILWWDTVYSNYKSKCMFSDRNPCITIDGGGIGIRKDVDLPPITPHIKDFLRRYEFSYGDDEFVLDKWLVSKYPYYWHPNKSYPGMMKAIGDTEENMILGGLEIMDGEPNKNNTKYADAVIDMTGLKGYEKTNNIEYDRYRRI